MRRAMAVAVAAGVVCVALLGGCGRSDGDGSARKGPASSTSTVPAGGGSEGAAGEGTGGTESQLGSVDGLLKQLDEQLSADAQEPQDAD